MHFWWEHSWQSILGWGTQVSDQIKLENSGKDNINRWSFVPEGEA